MLTIDFVLSCVSPDDTEFRDHLATRGADGESIIEHMARTGISLADERAAFEAVKFLQNRAQKRPCIPPQEQR